MATAQPISFSSVEQQDFTMGSGSFTGPNGSFNPASYTRHLIGSPFSSRVGSFGSRFYPGMSPGGLLGPLDPNDFKFGKMSSSIESDRGSIVNALHVFDRQDELARDYTCCGLNLNDLHALVDHFEECHVVVLDPYAPQQSHPQANSSMPSSATPQTVSYFSDANGVSNQHASQQPQSISYQGFDPDDMELDVDQHPSAPSSGAPSPPDTPVSTPLSSYPSYSHSALPSPALAHASQPTSPISAFDTTTVLPSRAHHMSGFRSSVGGSAAGSAARTEDAFNAYAGYSDYSSLLPGTNPLNGGANAMFMQQQSQLANMSLGPMGANGNQSACAPTALLLSNSAGNTPDSTPASSRVASPTPGNSTAYRAVAPSGSQNALASGSNAAASSSGAASPRASTTLSRPASSLLLSKPFRCPKPNCNKSYKQANGLKYHMTHGSCNFAPPKDLEHLQELLASKRSEKAAKAGENGTMTSESDVTLSDAELREVEKEAERRLRPYACGVGDCQRRYKNMNGLRYHYQHSGDHGAIGLALLASGQHECLQHNKSHSRHATPSQPATPSQSSPRSPTTPSGQSSFAQQQASFSHPPSYQSATVSPPTYSYQSASGQQYAPQSSAVPQSMQQYAQAQATAQQQQQSHQVPQGYSMALQQ
ncbi:hypothetical protein BC628DRAFT_1327946 [Trametes gibbosa]|uniref:Zinc finger protein 230 n=1 Tax=Trametes gibbosa TaxID=160864 RepID=A0A6B9KD56_9APHY|nr:hypothetical protein BC628DRAFT_1327946 [Trametes gibbosa]QHA24603.1 zinc finger protein 230 [Trametes gibbosa]QIE48592.1 hypothetical protein [Trametes gibbosa]